MSLNKFTLATGGLAGVTLCAGAMLTNITAHADDNNTVDRVSITVPIFCTMSSTGTNSHIASIGNGTLQSDIGTTTINTFCNDNEGFAIYTIGYTDNIEGKNVLTDATLKTNNNNFEYVKQIRRDLS